jgi:hypothetical protein
MSRTSQNTPARPTRAPETIFPSPSPILEERLRAIRHRLMLIQAASVAGADELSFEPEAILEAIYTATIEALDLLEPICAHLQALPASPSNWMAPEAGALAGTR